MYNRKTLCLLAGIKLEAFKEAARIDPETGLDNLPITVQPLPDLLADASNSIYAKYTSLDVLAVACAQQLAAGGGYVNKALSFASAAKIVSNSVGQLGEAVRKKRHGEGLIFVGYVTLKQGGFNVCNTMGQIGIKITSDYADDVVNLFLTAPATVVAEIEARAAEAGIDWKTERLWRAE
jgi:hypothetical protein